MTNEEKVATIVGRARAMLPMMRSQLGDSVTGYAEYFKKSLLKMAEWKDQQAELLTQTAYESGYDKARQEMKEYLEKMKTKAYWEMSKSHEDGDEWGFHIAEKNKQLFQRIINELFGREKI